MDKDTALRLALKAMESFQNGTNGLYEGEFEEEIAAIKAALEKKAENAEELGLDYYVPCCTEQTCSKCKAATPPQRTWVGLTDDDKEFIAKRASVYDWHDYEVIEATEAKLKEKNYD